MTDEEIAALQQENTDLKNKIVSLVADLAQMTVARDAYKKGFETQSAARRADADARKPVMPAPEPPPA